MGYVCDTRVLYCVVHWMISIEDNAEKKTFLFRVKYDQCEVHEWIMDDMLIENCGMDDMLSC